MNNENAYKIWDYLKGCPFTEQDFIEKLHNLAVGEYLLSIVKMDNIGKADIQFLKNNVGGIKYVSNTLENLTLTMSRNIREFSNNSLKLSVVFAPINLYDTLQVPSGVRCLVGGVEVKPTGFLDDIILGVSIPRFDNMISGKVSLGKIN